MAAILRVKRKKDEEPLDALLISCKRIRVEEAADSEEPLTAVVRFAGTVEKPENCAVEHISKSLSREYLKTNYKQHIVNVSQKAREKTKQESIENRYKIVNSIRSVDAALAGQLDEDVVNIIDVEDTQAIPDEKNADGYVWDLYYTQVKEDLQVDNLLYVLPVEENELVFEDAFKDDEEDGDTSDSNSESNIRNEYPDTDEDNSSIGENDIRSALKKLDIDEDYLSSDDEELAYGLDEQDVERYGYKYAKFKARIKKEEAGETGSTDDDDDCSSNEENNTDEADDEYGERSDDE